MSLARMRDEQLNHQRKASRLAKLTTETSDK